MGPLAKTGRATVEQAAHAYCGHEVTYKRGKQASSKDNTRIDDITVMCFRKSGHDGPHRNGRAEWYG